MMRPPTRAMTKKTDQAGSVLLEQPFVTHLLELRDRLLRMVLVVFVVFLGLFPFANDIYIIVATPLMAHLPPQSTMIATEVASPFLTPFKLSLMAAVILSIPFILYHLWSFIAPGLYKHEKRMVIPLVVSSTILFYTGMLFAYYIVFPLVFQFLIGATPDGVTVATDISKYLDFVLTLFFAFGMAFEIPIATILLVWMGATTPKKLVDKRPYIIVGAFCFGMLLTPPDVISQTLLAIPMWILFELGVIFSRIFVPKREDAVEEEKTADTTDEAQPRGRAKKSSTAPDLIPGFVSDPVVSEGEMAIDEERFVPLTEAELDAELDLIEEEDDYDYDGDGADLGTSDDDGEYEEVINGKLKQVQVYRDEGDTEAARALLNEVLDEGNDDQANVAQNILSQLDED